MVQSTCKNFKHKLYTACMYAPVMGFILLFSTTALAQKSTDTVSKQPPPATIHAQVNAIHAWQKALQHAQFSIDSLTHALLKDVANEMDSLEALRSLLSTRQNMPSPASIHLAAEYMPSIAFRTVAYGTALPADNSSNINLRNNTEYSVYGHYLGIYIGLTSRLSHTFYANPFIITQGFGIRNASLSWAQGISRNTPVNAVYEFQYKGIAAGYRYAGYKNMVNFVFDIGIYHMRQDTLNWFRANVDAEKIYGAELGRNLGATGFRIGTGINFVPGYKFSMYLVPTATFNLTSVNRGTINTYFYNVGLTAGVSYNTISKKHGISRLPNKKEMYRRHKNKKGNVS